jgi:hypothetical protein
MKNLIIILIITIVSSVVTAQTIDNLEKKKGFKLFIIGQPKAKFEKNLTYYSASSNGSIGYEYRPNNDDEITVFNYKFDHIFLYFDKTNKLEAIKINKKFVGDNHNTIAFEELIEIMKNLRQMFGKASFTSDQPNLSKFGYLWSSQTIALSLQNEYLGLEIGSENYIIIALDNKPTNSGF